MKSELLQRSVCFTSVIWNTFCFHVSEIRSNRSAACWRGPFKKKISLPYFPRLQTPQTLRTLKIIRSLTPGSTRWYVTCADVLTPRRTTDPGPPGRTALNSGGGGPGSEILQWSASCSDVLDESSLSWNDKLDLQRPTLLEWYSLYQLPGWRIWLCNKSAKCSSVFQRSTQRWLSSRQRAYRYYLNN